MKIGICEQPEISKKVLELIDFIELKTISKENIAFFSQFQKPFLWHCQFIDNKGFALSDDFLDLFTKKEVGQALNLSLFTWISFHLGLATKKYIVKKGYPVGISKPIGKKELLQQLSEQVIKLKKLIRR